jgi:hypothetical protein
VRPAIAILGLLLAAGGAGAGVEVLSVESATGGIWRPGRFSPARLRVRASPGTHEIRGRLEPGKIVVVTLRSAGDGETVLLPLLPERDSDAVEIDAGRGWESHPLPLRRHDAKSLVIGVVEGLDERLDVDAVRVPLPADGGHPALRDVCDLVLDAAWLEPAERWPRLAAERDGALPSGPVVSGLLADRFASAAVPSDRARDVLPALAVTALVVLGAVLFARRRGWPGPASVGIAAVLTAALVLAWWGVSDPMPRATCRGVSLVRSGGGRMDLLVLAARGHETLSPRFSGDGDVLVRPLPDRTGRIGPYTLRTGRGLVDLDLGPGRLGFVRVDRDWPLRASNLGAVAIRPVEDAFWSHGETARWHGDAWPAGSPGAPPQPITAVLDRFRETGGTHARTLRGRLLVKVARPALRPGPYGFLADPPALDAGAIGVERAEIVEAMLVP